jgi:excisionase family DNA binding protein
METALTANEVAQFLKVSPRTVCKLAAKGEIPGRKIGNRWRFSPLVLQLWLAGEEFSKYFLSLQPWLFRDLASNAAYPTILREEDKTYQWGKKRTGNPNVDFFGCLASNPLSQEVADFIQAEKERQRQEAIAEADAYDNR